MKNLFQAIWHINVAWILLTDMDGISVWFLNQKENCRYIIFLSILNEKSNPSDLSQQCWLDFAHVYGRFFAARFLPVQPVVALKKVKVRPAAKVPVSIVLVVLFLGFFFLFLGCSFFVLFLGCFFVLLLGCFLLFFLFFFFFLVVFLLFVLVVLFLSFVFLVLFSWFFFLLG